LIARLNPFISSYVFNSCKQSLSQQAGHAPPHHDAKAWETFPSFTHKTILTWLPAKMSFNNPYDTSPNNFSDFIFIFYYVRKEIDVPCYSLISFKRIKNKKSSLP